MKLLLAVSLAFAAWAATDQTMTFKKEGGGPKAPAAGRGDYKCRNLYPNVPLCHEGVTSGKCLQQESGPNGGSLMQADGKKRYQADMGCKPGGRLDKRTGAYEAVICTGYYQVAPCGKSGPGESCLVADKKEIRLGRDVLASNCSPARTDKD